MRPNSRERMGASRWGYIQMCTVSEADDEVRER